MDPSSLAKALFFATAFLLHLFQALSSSGSVVFIDSPGRPYFRSPQSGHPTEYDFITSFDVAAAVAILLDGSPPASLSAESSKEINELLVPNPFRKPRAVFVLDVQQCADHSLLENQSKFELGGTFIKKDLQDSDPIEIQLTDEDDVSLSSLSSKDDIHGDFTSSAETLIGLAKFVGGSYSSGVLKIPFADGTHLSLDMAKKADSEYVRGLLSLRHHMRTEPLRNENTSASMEQSALFIGSFKGLKVLQEEYGKGVMLDHGVEIFVKILAKLFDSLQRVYGGDLVGVILFDGHKASASEEFLSVKVHGGGSRLLEEMSEKNSSDAAELKLVMRTLAWITGLILLVSTLIGVYLLLSMPLTKDTLLYSNVKID